MVVITSNEINSKKEYSAVPYLSRVDSLRDVDDAGNARVDDGNRVVLNVGGLLYVLLHLADPPFLQLLQALHMDIYDAVTHRRFRPPPVLPPVGLLQAHAIFLSLYTLDLLSVL